MPYWQGGPAYSPWAAGYFGGYATSGLLPGFLLGTMLAPGWDGDGGGWDGDGGGGDGGDGGGGDGGGDGGDGGGTTAAATAATPAGRRRRFDFGGGDFGGFDFGGDFGGF